MRLCALLLLTACAGRGLTADTSAPIAPKGLVFAEKGGLVAVEAEHFVAQARTDKRAFHITGPKHAPKVEPDGDPAHADTASGGAYVEALPDTRRTHDDKLVKGENFSDEPGAVAVLTYKVNFATTGRYYVWVRAYSTGTEDNGIHVGLDGKWPESGRRMQWSEGKNSWRWDSKQRTAEVHTGVPGQIYLDIEKAGVHEIHFSMREDGFEFDRWLMTTDKEFKRPADAGPASVVHEGEAPKPFEAQKEKAKKPNVVFILADDLGGHDIGCYGSTFHKTPHLDALAKRGMKFTDAYSASPLCSPTRSSILTGLHPARVGITAPVCHNPEVQLEKKLNAGGPNAKVLAANSLTRLKTEYVTLPEVLKAAGYRTGHFGKWHLGPEPYSPLQHGFDVDLPHMSGPGPGGANGYFAPWQWWKGEGKAGDHIDDRMGEEAAKFIAENKDRPFFLNYWAFGVHSPWMGKKEYVEEAAKRMDPKAGQRNPVYAAMVRSLDDSVGRIVAELEKCKLLDNTIIVFTSDNGGWHNVAKEATNNKDYADIPVTSNAPLRSGKASNYEGGTRVPFLVVWPGRTKAGSTSDTVIQSTDMFPTLLAVTGTPAPKDLKFDGVDVSAAFTGQAVKREMIFSHFPHGGRADIDGFRPGTWVRKGDWKLIRFFAAGDDGSDKLELFNLKDDIGETKNRAAEKPELAKELNAHISAFLKDTEAVVPKANPNYKKPAPAVAGWTPSKDAALSAKDGKLVVTSTGTDPYIVTQDVPKGAGPYTLELTLASDSKGDAQVFWATADAKPFHRDRSVQFAVTHDKKPHAYTVKVPSEQPLTGLRLDPSAGPGTISVEKLRLLDKDGKELKAWAGGK
jgi:arylsulfatase A-like enzyme